MASLHKPLEEKLKCSICSEIFKDPVVLRCSHSFCKACLDKNWNHKKVKECLLCKKPSKHAPLHNLSLKDVCESFIEEKRRRTSAEPPGVICLSHTEKQQLFCEDDKMLVCMQCVSRDHKDHKFLSISKVAREHKAELQKSLKKLQSDLQTWTSKKSDYTQSSAQGLQAQVQQTEKQIKNEFEKLHQFLREEEEAKIAVLKKDKQEKQQRINKNIKEFDKICSDLSEQIKQLQNEITGDDSLFLHNLKNIQERANYTVMHPELDPTLIDVAKHLGNLKFRVWEKMKDISPYYPVILQPGTKMSKIHPSDDLTSITSGPGQIQPTSPDKGIPFILGSEGFSSGAHSWEVEIGDSKHWAVGVSDKGITSLGLSLMYHFKGEASWNSAAATFTRVRVTLDIEQGQVMFTDPDTNTTLQTEAGKKFTEKMYPCFYTSSQSPMKILPSKVSVSVPSV